MFGCCANYLITTPDITVYMNCDTRFAINLSAFDLSEYDEFIFTIKNYDYIDSSYAFLFRASKADMDHNGEVIFNIDPDASKNIKPGAFYNFALLVNAFNSNKPTEYKKLTENGKVIIEYGAQDLALPDPPQPPHPFGDILAARVELMDNADACKHDIIGGALVDIKLESLDCNELTEA